MIYLLGLLIVNLIFNNLFLNQIFNNDIDATLQILTNLQNDFTSIGFPVNFSINAVLISTWISFILTLIIFINFKNKTKPNNPVVILKDLVHMFFIYSGVIFASFYLLRLYSLSRGLILLALIIYPFLIYSVYYFLRFIKFNNLVISKGTSFLFLILLFGVLAWTNNRNSEELNIDSITTTTTTTTTVFQTGIVGTECSKWMGSDNFTECIYGAEIVDILYFSESLNNVIAHNNDLYILDVFGKVYKNSPDDIFIDVSSKVLNRFDFEGDSGLFSLAFHPSENYFLISYSDNENNLVFEKYLLDNENRPLNNEFEVVLKIPNSSCCHYSGNILWSDFLNDFIISVGDMGHTNKPLENSNPLNTTSPIGKILLLNKEISNPELLSLLDTAPPLKNLIAYGLRNPWKTYVYKNFLFVQDVGLTNEEELNILNLEELKVTQKPFLLGWPHFEGTINNNVKFNEIFIHDETGSKSINDFISRNTIIPNVYYSHVAPENYRAAIIGGGLIEDTDSKYFEHYFFADYLSGEIFSYDFKNNELRIIPIAESLTFITSLSVHPTLSDTILVTTGSGNLVKIKLP